MVATGRVLAVNASRLHDLRAGDVLLISIPSAFWAQLASDWSLPQYRHGHAGIVTGLGLDGPMVVHASGNPSRANAIVVKVPLRQFLVDAARVDVFRPIDVAAGERAAAAASKYAREKLGFDDAFSVSTPQRLYCTELIWRALSYGFGHDILPHKSRLVGREAILLSDLETSAYLTLVQTARGSLFRSDRNREGTWDEKE